MCLIICSYGLPPLPTIAVTVATAATVATVARTTTVLPIQYLADKISALHASGIVGE
jgi:hypothetical protein